VAREYGYYPAILYAYLQKEMEDYANLHASTNLRIGLRWIPGLSYETIQRDLPVFPDVKTVKSAAKELLDAGLVLAESTGAFLPDHLKTQRKRDIATWWHVSRDHVGRANVPAIYFNESMLLRFSSQEAVDHGVSAALILGHWRTLPVDLVESGRTYKSLVAAKLEELLPMDERTARRQLKNLVKAGALIQHPKRKKLYAPPKT
jgi:hypothetical protein